MGVNGSANPGPMLAVKMSKMFLNCGHPGIFMELVDSGEPVMACDGTESSVLQHLKSVQIGRGGVSPGWRCIGERGPDELAVEMEASFD